MKRWVYPFSAMVEQEAMQEALLLNAVDPLIGGVLIRGGKGTGKSTAARALGRVLPDIEVVQDCPFNSDPQQPILDPTITVTGMQPGAPLKIVRRAMPFVELPLNATEDRLAGALHFEKTLQSGQRHFEPGLLAAANRGVLYVDEVNLLDDHLVDLLLDAAASGVNVVEREGLSFTHPARFVLLGTMNPEEGELRPQFLDRFGLCVVAENVTASAARESIVRRRLACDANPESFAAEWAPADQLVADHIVLARARLSQVHVPDSMINWAAQLASALNVCGHRADITLIKAARARAALLEKDEIERADIVAVAPFAMFHRIPASPLDSPAALQQKITRVLSEWSGKNHPLEAREAGETISNDAEADDNLETMAEQMQVPGGAAAGSIVLSFLKKKTLTLSSPPTRV